MKRRLKKFFKSLTPFEYIQLIGLLFVILVALMLIAYFLFVGEPEIHETPVGSYTCQGGLIKVCTGSKEVYDYLGV